MPGASVGSLHVHPSARPCVRVSLSKATKIKVPVSSLDILTWVRAEFAELLGKCLGRVPTTSSRATGTAFDDRIYQSFFYFVDRASCLRIVRVPPAFFARYSGCINYRSSLHFYRSARGTFRLPANLRDAWNKSLRCKYCRVRLRISIRIASLGTTGLSSLVSDTIRYPRQVEEWRLSKRALALRCNNRKVVTRPPTVPRARPLSRYSTPSRSLLSSFLFFARICALGGKGNPRGKIMALRVKSRMHIKRYYFAR